MAVARVGDHEIAYELLGPDDGEPWVVTPGGRFSKDYGDFRSMGEALAAAGKRVLLHDRVNCGASSVAIEGPSESVVQADALAGLIRELGLGPTVIVGGSGGARVSLLTAARHPDIAKALAIWWISGGSYGNLTLAMHYCGGSVAALWNGTMADVAALDEWQEVIERNPSNRDRFLAMDRDAVLATLDTWMHAYCACGDQLVPGLTDDEVAGMSLPILVFRSGVSDLYHTRETSERLAAGLPGARLVEPPWGDREWIERGIAVAERGEALFDRWKLLVPQLIDWTSEVL